MDIEANRRGNAHRTPRTLTLTVLADDAEVAVLHDMLTALVCGPEDHAPPCVLPWSAGSDELSMKKKRGRQEFEDLAPIEALSSSDALVKLRERLERLLKV